MAEDNVISLAIASGDGSKWSPEQAIEYAHKLCSVENDIFNTCNKVLIIALDDTHGYEIGWIQSNLKNHEMIALCRVMETRALTLMNYINKHPNCEE